MIPNPQLLHEFNHFLGKAALATYAGGGSELDPEEPGFKELRFKEKNWDYLDRYTGYFQSWGQELVKYKGKPFWNQLYGGGMEKEHHGNIAFAHQTYDFLKKALSAGEKQGKFQPRGPRLFQDQDWKYTCEWAGNIAKFKGSEKILFKNKLVFAHEFMGGLVVAKI